MGALVNGSTWLALSSISGHRGTGTTLLAQLANIPMKAELYGLWLRSHGYGWSKTMGTMPRRWLTPCATLLRRTLSLATYERAKHFWSKVWRSLKFTLAKAMWLQLQHWQNLQ